MILTTSGTTAGMNILLFVVLIVFSTAQENYGLQNKQEKAKTRNLSSVNGTTLTRSKRYVPHMNSLLRNFNFFNNDGMHLYSTLV